MSDELKPIPCPFCAQELVKTTDNYGLAWKHPHKPGVCIAIGIVLGDSGDIAEWNHRPAEDALRSKLAIAITSLEWIQSMNTWSASSAAKAASDAAKDALAKIRS